MLNVKKTFGRLALVTAFSLSAQLVVAAESIADLVVKGQTPAASQLTELLAGYERFTGQFEQAVTNSAGRTIDEQRGSLTVVKPNKFVWHVVEPFEQHIVSNGVHVWLYDPELEQVTQKRADNSQDNAAALVLNGRVAELSEQFNIQQVPLTGQPTLKLFELVPYGEDSSFSRIRLLFSDGSLSEFLLEDQLGQRTSVVLHDVTVNPEVDEAQFEFEIPAGVDLIVDEAR